MIARFDQARAEDDNEIESYCRSAVAMFIAAHDGKDQGGHLPTRRSKEGRSLAADRRKKAKRKVKSGYGDKGVR
jgi:hypothetical protein